MKRKKRGGKSITGAVVRNPNRRLPPGPIRQAKATPAMQIAASCARVKTRPLGFEQFSLRGLQKVSLEWTLVCAAYNRKRLHQLLNPAHQKPKTPKPPKPTPPVLVQLLSELFGLYGLAFKTNFSAHRSLSSLSKGPYPFPITYQPTLYFPSKP